MAISVRDLRKSYGDTPAARGISFEVARADVFGLLGANSAGKTTTIEIFEGYRAAPPASSRYSAGTRAGSPAPGASGIGLVLQECELDQSLTVRKP